MAKKKKGDFLDRAINKFIDGIFEPIKKKKAERNKEYLLKHDPEIRKVQDEIDKSMERVKEILRRNKDDIDPETLKFFRLDKEENKNKN